MRKSLAFCLATLAWGAQAQTINLHGSVTNKAGKPVANAIVALQGKGLKDTSGADGSYSIVQSDVLSISPSSPRINGISLDGGDLVVALNNPSSIKVEFFDLRGNLLKEDRLQTAGKGRDRFSLATASGKSALMIVRVSVGGQSTSFQCLALGTGRVSAVGIGAARTAAAAVDTLVATASGYTSGKLPITSYDQTANIVLDTAATVARSAGCDKTKTLVNGTLSLQSGGKTRKYILNVPASYDKTQAYRLVFAFAESGSSAQSVATRNYFTMATYDTKTTIFAAPDAENGAGSWANTDVAFTDAILAQLEGDLCIDKTRIFATGFSFGAGMSMALACTRADVFRAVAFFSGADLTGSCPTTLTKPIAYYASQASQDGNGMSPTNPMTGEMKQAQFAAVNGCTAEPAATTFPAAGKAHTCTIYKNCSAGHPTVYCTFNGPHGWEPKDPGQSTSWDAPEAWKFITQF
jgi:poly(3-hydroxybutyrate) depolymerase